MTISLSQPFIKFCHAVISAATSTSPFLDLQQKLGRLRQHSSNITSGPLKLLAIQAQTVSEIQHDPNNPLAIPNADVYHLLEACCTVHLDIQPLPPCNFDSSRLEFCLVSCRCCCSIWLLERPMHSSRSKAVSKKLLSAHVLFFKFSSTCFLNGDMQVLLFNLALAKANAQQQKQADAASKFVGLICERWHAGAALQSGSWKGQCTAAEAGQRCRCQPTPGHSRWLHKSGYS